MAKGWGTAQGRRRVRTAVLGVVAFAALIWGAIDIVGVPPANLWQLLQEITVGVVLLIVVAALPATLLHLLRQRRRRD